MRIFELRKNPEQNIRDELHTELKKYNNLYPGNCWASFTAIPKLGINPRSKHETPIGIYSYPVDYILKESSDARMPMSSSLPFAGGEDYCNIFKINGYILNLDTMTESMLMTYVNDLRKILMKIDEKIAGNLDLFVKQSKSRALVNTVGGMFWYIMMTIAVDIAIIRSKQTPVVWNWLFRQLNIDAANTENEIIHENEPTQCVVFNPTSIELLSRVENKRTRSPFISANRKNIAKRMSKLKNHYHEILNKHDAKTDDELAELFKYDYEEFAPLLPVRVLKKILPMHGIDDIAIPSLINRMRNQTAK